MPSQSVKVLKPVDGILLLDKPVGISSNKALQIARYHFQAKKAGHTGSLDPLASGMLPICFGQASKVTSFLLDADKSYTLEAELGKISTTGDAEGEIIEEKAIPHLNKEAFETIIKNFVGKIEQIPPMYSALKHNGVPLYKLARQGINIERKARKITIYTIGILEFTGTRFRLNVHCSKGTYIRSLVEDIGKHIGCGAYLTQLRRTTVTPFENYPMHTLQTIESITSQSKPQQLLLPLDTALKVYPEIQLTHEQSTAIKQGQKLKQASSWELIESTGKHSSPLHKSIIRLYDPQQTFIGMGQLHTDNTLVPRRLMSTQQ